MKWWLLQCIMWFCAGVAFMVAFRNYVDEQLFVNIIITTRDCALNAVGAGCYGLRYGVGCVV